MSEAPRLLKLKKLGQSVWYDNISRELLQSGGLKEILDWGVVGLTSNPSIFEKAISSSNIYDSDIQNMKDEKYSDLEVFEKLAIEDIQNTADLLSETYKSSEGQNGYVSLEVNPHLANDTKGTIREAKRLHSEVGRQNLMIKVPATKAGIPAIHELISVGISVNVTLIFSIQMYDLVREAYVSGLEQFHKNTADLSKVASVASFFVSRVDTVVDKKLLENGFVSKKFLGRAGIANAKIAYGEFEKTFSSERYLNLRNAGAKMQRPLWASTSMKNPDMRDVLYVENLIGPNTVNTMPDVTLNAFIDHGIAEVTINEKVNDSYAHMEKLSSAGINLAEITDTLLEDGVKAFADSFDNLLQNISHKRSMLSVS